MKRIMVPRAAEDRDEVYLINQDYLFGHPSSAR